MDHSTASGSHRADPAVLPGSHMGTLGGGAGGWCFVWGTGWNRDSGAAMEFTLRTLLWLIRDDEHVTVWKGEV